MSTRPDLSPTPQHKHGYVLRETEKKKGLFSGKKKQWVWCWIVLYPDLNRLEIYEEPKRKSRSKNPKAHLTPEPAGDFDPTSKGFQLRETIVLSSLSQVNQSNEHNSRFQLVGTRSTLELEAASSLSCAEWVKELNDAMSYGSRSVIGQVSDRSLGSAPPQRPRKLSARRKLSNNKPKGVVAPPPNPPKAPEPENSISAQLKRMEEKLKAERSGEHSTSKTPIGLAKTAPRLGVNGEATRGERKGTQIYDSQVFMQKARQFAEQASLPRENSKELSDVLPKERRFKSDTYVPIELDKNFLHSASFDTDLLLDGGFDASSLSARSDRIHESFAEIPEEHEAVEPVPLYVHRSREDTKLNQSSLERMSPLRKKAGTKDRQRRARRRNSTSSVAPMGRIGPRSAVMPILAKSMIEPLKRKPKPDTTMRMLRDVIQSSRQGGRNVLFEGLDKKSISEIIDRMQGVKVKAGDVVVKQGEKDSNFFVVERGVFNVYTLSSLVSKSGDGPPTRKKDLISVKQPGSYFGELALLYERRGNVTVEAVSDGMLWSLTRQAFHEVLTASSVRQQVEKLRLVTEVPLIVDNLSVQNIIALSDAMETSRLEDGAVILSTGSPLKKMYIVQEGKAMIGVPSKEDPEKLVFIDSLASGETFGEWALLDYNAISDVTIVAAGETVVLMLDVQEFDELIGPLRDFVMKRWQQTLAIDLPNQPNNRGQQKRAKSLKKPKSKERIRSAKKEKPPPPPVKGARVQIPEKLSALRESQDDDFDRQSSTFSFASLEPVPEGSMEEGENVVAQALFDARKRFSQKRVQSSKNLEGKYGAVGSSGRERQKTKGKEPPRPSTLDPQFAETLADMESLAFGGGDASTNLDKPWVSCDPLRPDIKFSDLVPVSKLGRGHFGTVHLVLHKERTVEQFRNYDSKSMNRAKNRNKRQSRKKPKMIREAFALKCLAREYIVSNGWQKLVENERSAMLELTHFSDSPFLLKLFNTYVDEKNVYFLFEVCRGGDLYAALKHQPEQRFTNEGAVKFYAGSAILGLSAMHERSIIFRDLKPENMLLDDEGFVKIGDFGLAKKSTRTFTVCGTPDYMAPETILSRGHDTAVDWWALGVLIYELVFGVTPFFGDEPMDIYERILQHEHEDDIDYPDRSQISERGVSIITRLLHPKRTRRLGNLRSGVAGVMFHPFFQHFNWDALQNLRMTVPYAPDLCETNNFDNVDEISTDYDANMFRTPNDRSSWKPSF